jgi:hypothetical protein
MNFFGQTGAFIMSIFFGRIVYFTHSFDAQQLLMAGILMLGAFFEYPPGIRTAYP